MKRNQEQKVKVKRMNLHHQSIDKKEEKDLYCIPKTNTLLFLVSPRDTAVVLLSSFKSKEAKSRKYLSLEEKGKELSTVSRVFNIKSYTR